MPGQKYYDKTQPEDWFRTEEEALVAGYRKSKI
jgi:micrococcal nuclease